MTDAHRPSPVAGDMLAHYRVIERLASGGMGLVYGRHTTNSTNSTGAAASRAVGHAKNRGLAPGVRFHWGFFGAAIGTSVAGAIASLAIDRSGGSYASVLATDLSTYVVTDAFLAVHCIMAFRRIGQVREGLAHHLAVAPIVDVQQRQYGLAITGAF